ncbi:MAG: ABC transporter ATP-binding protein [Sulfitobacter sp.]
MNSNQDPLLSCRSVTRRFGALVAVDAIDLDVARGETLGIGGPNGAGKTTFFDLITGLTSVSEGRITFDGQPINGLAPHSLCQMGMARTFQLNSGFDGMTVYENVLTARAFGRRSSGGWLMTHRADKRAATEALERFGLADIAQDLVADIPVLARKKLMVATAIINEPSILLLDEPVGGLTPPEIDDFIELVLSLKAQGMTLVFIEHVMKFLMVVADRAMIMHQGATIYDGAPAGMSADAAVTEVYLGNTKLFSDETGASA